jgi:hypothetical protein
LPPHSGVGTWTSLPAPSPFAFVNTP